MLLNLLLQTTTRTITTTEEVPIAVYVTFLAAVMAALASLNATRISSRTAKEVGTLASQTAQESARIASETAQAIKDKEYKNDYYKKVIDKRIKAIEEAEVLVGMFSEQLRLTPSNDKCHAYFLRHMESGKHVETINKLTAQATWFSRETEEVLTDMVRAVNHVVYYANQVGRAAQIRIFVMEFTEISILKNRLEYSLSKDMQSLYDVPLFHSNKLEHSLKVLQEKENSWPTVIGPDGTLIL